MAWPLRFPKGIEGCRRGFLGHLVSFLIFENFAMNSLPRRFFSIVKALSIWTYLKLASMAMAFAAFSEDWRSYFDSANTAHAVKFLSPLLMVVPLYLLLRGRLSLPLQGYGPPSAPDRADRVAVALILATPFAAFLPSVDSLADASLMEGRGFGAIAASLLAIASLAIFEELIFRFALMGLLLRAGLPAVAVLLIQAALFVMSHGSAPYVAPESLLRYSAGALTLGGLYLVSRTLWAPILLHVSVNLLLAQGMPAAYWIALPLAESTQRNWFHGCTRSFIAIGACWCAWRLFQRRAAGSMAFYNRAPWMTPSPRWRTPRPIRATPSPARAARSANSPMN